MTIGVVAARREEVRWLRVREDAAGVPASVRVGGMTPLRVRAMVVGGGTTYPGEDSSSRAGVWRVVDPPHPVRRERGERNADGTWHAWQGV